MKEDAPEEWLKGAGCQQVRRSVPADVFCGFELPCDVGNCLEKLALRDVFTQYFETYSCDDCSIRRDQEHGKTNANNKEPQRPSLQVLVVDVPLIRPVRFLPVRSVQCFVLRPSNAIKIVVFIFDLLWLEGPGKSADVGASLAGMSLLMGCRQLTEPVASCIPTRFRIIIDR